MNLNHFLNAIVTALSVATVLITLMSFLIFKIRQFPKNNGESDEKIDGTFFKKYDPFCALIRASQASEKPIMVQGRRLRITAIGFFSAISFAIFAAIMVQNFATDRQEAANVASTDAERLGTLKSHESLLAGLKKQGLLQRFAMTNTVAGNNIEEFISIPQKEAFAENLHALSDLHFVLIRDDSKNQVQSPHHRASFDAWSEYFKNIPVEFKTVNLSQLSTLASADRANSFSTVVILPQLASLDRDSRHAIQSMHEKGLGLIATGPIGALGSDGRPAPTDWSGRVFGVTFQSNDYATKFEPSIFAADRAPFSKLSAGFMADWFPTDNSYVGVSRDPDASVAFQTDYNGKIAETAHGNTLSRAVFTHPAGKMRAAWLAIEPGNLQKLGRADRFYAESFLATSLLWVAREPVAALSNWKNGATSAFLASVDSEDKFEGATRLMQLFESKEIPATFFIVSNLLVKDSTLAKTVSSFKGDRMDLQSHTTDHTILEGLNFSTQFDKLQDARLAIEEITGKPVIGFRPPEERFDDFTLSAALQNHVHYFFGDQKHYRYSPLQIANGDLIYFPRSVLDDFNLRDQNFGSDDLMLQKMQSDFRKAKLLGGAYFMSFHSQVFGQPNFQALVSHFLDFAKSEKPWFSNYSQAADWWRDREQIKIHLSKNGASAKYEMQIKNNSPHAQEGLAVYVDTPMAESWNLTSTPSLNASEKTPPKSEAQAQAKAPPGVSNFSATQVNGSFVVRIAALEPGETIAMEAKIEKRAETDDQGHEDGTPQKKVELRRPASIKKNSQVSKSKKPDKKDKKALKHGKRKHRETEL